MKNFLNNHPKIKLTLIAICFVVFSGVCSELNFIVGAETSGYSCYKNAEGVTVCNK